ncbi:hypothetical protein HY061_01000 [Candidatus Azambacteria bacterium]|nr:hypothetical protein [Candidatus Azambacteria bacterium]
MRQENSHRESPLININTVFEKLFAFVNSCKPHSADFLLTLIKSGDSDRVRAVRLVIKSNFFQDVPKDLLQDCLNSIDSSELKNSEEGKKFKEYLEGKLKSKEPRERADLK